MGHLRLDIHVHDTVCGREIAFSLFVEEAMIQVLQQNATEKREWRAYSEMNIHEVSFFLRDRIMIEAASLSRPLSHHQYSYHTNIAPRRPWQEHVLYHGNVQDCRDLDGRMMRSISERPMDLRVRLRKRGGTGRLMCRQVRLWKPTGVRP
jgi:hypothetical protein